MSRSKHLKSPFKPKNTPELSVVIPEGIRPTSKVIEVELPNSRTKKKGKNSRSGNASFTVVDIVDVAPIAPSVPKKLKKLHAPAPKVSKTDNLDPKDLHADDRALSQSTKTNQSDHLGAKISDSGTHKSSKRRLRMPKGSTPKNYSNRLTLPELINAESAIGRTLFGPIPVGHQREFFTSRRNVWIWHESWTDQLGRVQKYTVRYEVRPEGVFKRTDQSPYQRIEGEELDNFRATAKTYLNLIKRNLYS